MRKHYDREIFPRMVTVIALMRIFLLRVSLASASVSARVMARIIVGSFVERHRWYGDQTM
ncbi:hypothetical protein NJ76_23130 [Rhodococcus sp. IITR03]|nr:hypothetical protein NJ76_23130 [Rhodococcus sp. IITR03]